MGGLKKEFKDRGRINFHFKDKGRGGLELFEDKLVRKTQQFNISNFQNCGPGLLETTFNISIFWECA